MGATSLSTDLLSVVLVLVREVEPSSSTSGAEGSATGWD
ncbi:hypothetical protein STRDD10_00886 [Streptococcus sp. DD10]|nr:hypothetical protein STRDD10_00886 [Streptococcus sp. DD10]